MATPDAFLAQCSEQGAELASLLGVAARAKHALKPVAPAPAFHARLRDGLLMAAHHQQAHRLLIAEQHAPQWGWLLGAAAVGSAAGLIAVMLRARQGQRQAEHVAPASAR